MLFYGKNHEQPVTPDIALNGVRVTFPEQVKYLGVGKVAFRDK